MVNERVAVVTGAGGQDGFFLVRALLDEGWNVHAVRHHGGPAPWTSSDNSLVLHVADLRDDYVEGLIAEIEPEEIYNLAGASSVSRSFEAPLDAWVTNADAVSRLLESVRRKSPGSRFYQASSTEMFGHDPGGTHQHDEESPLIPQSPYAAAKAAAHMLCTAYRRAYDLRVACGLLSNHESSRRPEHFLTRKIVDHVRSLPEQRADDRGPLVLGNLKAHRDWGFAPDYVRGMRLILRQIAVRSDRGGRPLDDRGRNYRDYVLATGRTQAVWELVDRAFGMAGHELRWHLAGSDPTRWRADFSDGRGPAVVVDRALLRDADPLSISASPNRARRELGWEPTTSVDVFLKEMLGPID